MLQTQCTSRDYQEPIEPEIVMLVAMGFGKRVRREWAEGKAVALTEHNALFRWLLHAEVTGWLQATSE